MERYIGLDVHAASCTLAIVSGTGKRLRDFPVETSGQALIEAISAIAGHRHLIMEEGTQSAWLYETLERHVDEIVVANVRESRGQKNDSRDAYGLAEKLRTGTVQQSVFKAPAQFRRLREIARVHEMLVRDVVRVQARLKSTASPGYAASRCHSRPPRPGSHSSGGACAGPGPHSRQRTCSCFIGPESREAGRAAMLRIGCLFFLSPLPKFNAVTCCRRARFSRTSSSLDLQTARTS